MSWITGSPMNPLAVAPEPLPPLPGFPYLHRGAGAVIVGPTGGGRSSLVEAGAYDAGRAGLRVAYLGSEVTEGEWNARAADLAARRGDTIDTGLLGELGRVRYLDLFSVIGKAWADPGAWAEEVPRRYDVVWIDPLAVVASALDLNFDDRNREFVLFYDRLVQPITTAGVTVGMLDNVGHAIEAKARAKGASAKSDKPDLTFSCALQANPHGLIVTAHKIRSVRAPFKRADEWFFDRETQRIEPRGERSAAAPAFRPTVYMERVSKALEAEPGLSKKAVRSAVIGRNDMIDLALEILVAEGFLEVRKDGQTNHHHVVKAYRDEGDDDPETGQRAHRAPPCPDRAPGTVEGTVPTVPRAYTQGTGTGHGSNGTPGTPTVPRLVEVVPADDDDEARADDLLSRWNGGAA